MKPAPDEKLLDRARAILRRKHYAYNTEQRYLAWIKRFILFHGKRHPVHMGRLEIEAFLTHLAVKEQVAAATQNQALNAILFLYRTVLDRPIEFPLELGSRPSAKTHPDCALAGRSGSPAALPGRTLPPNW